MGDIVLLIGGWAGRKEVISQLRTSKYRVCYAEETAEALELLKYQTPCAVIMDEDQGSAPGIEMLEVLREATSAPIIVEGTGKEQDIVRALMLGADAYLDWSASPAAVLAYLRALLRRENSENTGADGPSESSLTEGRGTAGEWRLESNR
jgi:DNA-binding response OmpR family regulator